MRGRPGEGPDEVVVFTWNVELDDRTQNTEAGSPMLHP